MQTEPATLHTFIFDLFEAESDYGFKFDSIEACAKIIASGELPPPEAIHECEQPSVCSDVTSSVAERVRDLCQGEYSWRLLNWLQVNGAVSNAVRAA